MPIDDVLYPIVFDVFDGFSDAIFSNVISQPLHGSAAQRNSMGGCQLSRR